MEKRIVDLPASAYNRPIAARRTKYPNPNLIKEINIDQAYESPADADSIYGGTAFSIPASPPKTSEEEKVWTSVVPETAPVNTETWSSSLQTVLDQPPPTLPLKMLMGGVVFCLAFGYWTTWPIDEVGHARGVLVPKGEVYKIDPEEMGKVANVAVKEGDEVKAGQVLVELDTKIATTEVERLQQMLVALNTEYNQKQVLKERTRAEAATQIVIANQEIQAQRAAIAQAEANSATTRALLTQQQRELAAYQARRESLKPMAGNMQELRQKLQEAVKFQRKQIEDLRPLAEQGAIPKKYMWDQEQLLRDRESALIRSQFEEDSSIKQRLFEADQSMLQSQSNLTKNQGQIAQNLQQINQLQAVLAQKQAEERRTQIQAQQQIQQLEVDTTQLQAKMTESQNLLKGATEKLKQRFLTAPIDGVVSSINIHNAGEVVQPGNTVAEIIPQDAPMVLSAVLPNSEAGFVKTGMQVQVKLDAYPYQNYGIVSGKVTSISPDAKRDEKLGAVYKVEVTLDRNSITANNKTVLFKPGQTGTAEIITRQRRIADILLDPFKQMQKGGLNL